MAPTPSISGQQSGRHHAERVTAGGHFEGRLKRSSLRKLIAFGIQDLQSQLVAANATITAQRATITSLVSNLFGDRSDANVAEAARDEARNKVDQAIAAVGEGQPHIRRAERHFNKGIAALAVGNPRRAVHEFEEAFGIAIRILRHARTLDD